jgi:hypothetical protein
MNIFKTLLLVSLTALVASCGTEAHDHSNDQSFDKSQAIAIHDESGKIALQFHRNLAGQFAVTAHTDSTFILLAALDARYVEWKKTLVKLPGTECNHAEGEGHHHDHVAEAALEDLSDEELHELQLAIRAELDKIISEFNKIVGKDC